MSRKHPKRKSGRGRFAMLPLNVLADESVRSLSHSAFRVLALLAAQYKGDNNGELALTAKQAERHGVSRNTFYLALSDLEAAELIDRTYPASRVPPRPTMYALTWLAIDDTEYTQANRTPARIFRGQWS